MLASAAQRVIAVDPAELDDRALLPNVTHLACKAQDAVPQIRELAGKRGIGLLVSGGLGWAGWRPNAAKHGV